MSTNTGNSGSHVNFVSWNIKGMGSPIKRSRVFIHLKRLNADIVFLQQTHIRTTDQVRFKCPWISEVFHSNFNSKARGVAIFIGKSIHFSSSKLISHENGRYLIFRVHCCMSLYYCLIFTPQILMTHTS